MGAPVSVYMSERLLARIDAMRTAVPGGRTASRSSIIYDLIMRGADAIDAERVRRAAGEGAAK